jgi:protein-arginine kinase activator protein McsA
VKAGTELGELEKELKRAVEAENYERAAGIRDRIHALRSASEGR